MDALVVEIVVIVSVIDMHIAVFILLLFGIFKVFLIIRIDNDDVKFISNSVDEASEGMVKFTCGLILFDGLLEILTSLFILL